ncbi:MAG: class IV adenylate cyclase [Patescibacteria group bacterium]|jgi:adenylate cyclase class 2
MTMREIELKILDINVDEIRKKLLSLGAKEKPETLIIDESFDFPDGRIDTDHALFRLRQYPDRTEICYKGGRSLERGFLAHDEYETTVGDAEIVRKILNALGLISTRYREKYRTTFVLDDVEIVIDTYPDISPFLEIEGEEEHIRRILEKLGYTMDQTVNMTAVGVFKRYGVNADMQKFKKQNNKIQ